MTHREAYKKLKAMRILADELVTAQIAPYPIDLIRQKIDTEIRHLLVKAGIDAVGAEESLEWGLKR